MYSTHVPTSFADSIRIGAATGINTASITTPSLMMHMVLNNRKHCSKTLVAKNKIK
ncbi:MAG: hypothetical protein KBD04_05415 [Proteobacteria bacterium]|nr:hypothetical protein [Pseudomonadota bacterium]